MYLLARVSVSQGKVKKIAFDESQPKDFTAYLSTPVRNFVKNRILKEANFSEGEIFVSVKHSTSQKNASETITMKITGVSENG